MQSRAASELTRRALLKGAGIAGVGLVLAACGQSSASGKPAGASSATAPGTESSQGAVSASGASGWDEALRAARSEGTVNVYGGQGEEKRQALIEPFQRAFPGIKVNGTFAPGRDLTLRIVSERQAGKYLADVLMGPGASAILPLKPIGALAPLEPALLLPEVVDTSVWLNKHLWWLDASPPLTTLSFVANVQSEVAYNTKIVDPKEFTSFLDLLDPKWKGKMVCTDVRKAGAGAVATRFMYKNAALGPSYMQKLFGDMQLTLSNDNRQMIDWIVQGRFPVGLLQNPPDVLQAMSQGLPIDMVPGENLKEGATVGPSAGTISLLDKAPHPNAAKVFLNWVLSKDGQIAWQKYVFDNSARTDIPKDGIPAIFVPRSDYSYVSAATEEYAQLSDTIIPALISRAVDKT